MRIILIKTLLLIVLLTMAASAQTVWFSGSYDHARDLAAETGKYVLVMFSSGDG